MNDFLTEKPELKKTLSSSPKQDPVASRRSLALKASIFATGLAGIVAEYVMATIASYLVGNAVVQWTMIISVMLFAMGVGSRLSKYVLHNVLDTFILAELGLSLLCAISAIAAYFFTSYVQQVWLVIYPIAFSIGILIGIEIPLATRLNQCFEELRFNISSVMEKDYFGSLLGGLLFAFVALPHLGLTYAPIALGTVNLLVAGILFWHFRALVKHPKFLTAGFVTVPLLLIGLGVMAEPIVLYGEQQRYQDRVIYQEQTMYQKIVITEWKDYHWLYLDNNEQFSSYDEERYHEPLVHPTMTLSAARENVLIMGGGDGLAVREVLKHPGVKTVTVVDIDPKMTDLARTHPVFVKLNEHAFDDSRVKIVNRDAYAYLKDSAELYDVIIVDLPDPKTIELARLYTKEFYSLSKQHLSKGGTIVTQATSPLFAADAFICILKTMEAAGLSSVGMHNHVPTMGEWGWIIGINEEHVTPAMMKEQLSKMEFDGIKTRFLNHEAMLSMLNFGKGILDRSEGVQINDERNLILQSYYRQGSWALF
jgi:spermidine synthase